MMITRREALSALAVGGAASLWAGAAGASPVQGGAAAPASKPGERSPVPLGFDPTKLHGISEKLIVSHHDNNYAGAVKNLNKVEEQLASFTKDTPGFLVGALKERELTFFNSMVLHELYFANLGGDGKPAGAVEKALSETWGTFGKWEEEFRATGASLAGGSGWVILEHNLHTDTLATRWSGNHTQNPAAGIPLLVMDMYEHAYQMDYGAAALKYIDAFFQNIAWQEVEHRHERALKIAAVLRGS
jgi:Fe-Mn family superoxide dismutase